MERGIVRRVFEIIVRQDWLDGWFSANKNSTDGLVCQDRLAGTLAPPKTALAAALTDGEDFELLFTVASGSAVKLLDAWKKNFPKLKLSCIGKIVAGGDITIRDRTGVQKLNAHGYVHFA